MIHCENHLVTLKYAFKIFWVDHRDNINWVLLFWSKAQGIGGYDLLSNIWKYLRDHSRVRQHWTTHPQYLTQHTHRKVYSKFFIYPQRVSAWGMEIVLPGPLFTHD